MICRWVVFDCVIFLLRKSDFPPTVGVIFRSPLSFKHAQRISLRSNIAREVHITRQRRIELAHLR